MAVWHKVFVLVFEFSKLHPCLYPSHYSNTPLSKYPLVSVITYPSVIIPPPSAQPHNISHPKNIMKLPLTSCSLLVSNQFVFFLQQNLKSVSIHFFKFLFPFPILFLAKTLISTKTLVRVNNDFYFAKSKWLILIPYITQLVSSFWYKCAFSPYSESSFGF